ncbi:MAG: TolC family protein [Ferruginibacter sp.]
MHVRKWKNVFLLGLVFLSFNVLLAQDKVLVEKLSLETAVQKTLQQNAKVLLAKIETDLANAQYKSTEAVYLPQVNLSYSAMGTNNPLNAFGFKLQQKSIVQQDFNPVLLNDPGFTGDFTTKLSLQQPLVNKDMWLMRKAVKQQTLVQQYKNIRTNEYLAYITQQTYLQLSMAYATKDVLQESLKNMQLVQKFTTDRFNQGLIQKSDWLNVGVQVKTLETNLEEMNSAIAAASDYLNLLMNKPTGNIYLTDSLNNSIKAVNDSLSLNTQRADFSAMQAALKSYDLMIKSTKAAYLPRVNGFAQYQLNDNRMLGFGAGSYLVGLMVQWDIFSAHQTKNKLAKQQMERKQIQTQLEANIAEASVELRKAMRQYKDAQFQIQQRRLAVEQSGEALRILTNRYQQGLVNTTDVLMAQTQLSQQHLAALQATMNAQMAAYYMQFLTGISSTLK